jgi:hypothetical protein
MVFMDGKEALFGVDMSDQAAMFGHPWRREALSLRLTTSDGRRDGGAAHAWIVAVKQWESGNAIRMRDWTSLQSGEQA